MTTLAACGGADTEAEAVSGSAAAGGKGEVAQASLSVEQERGIAEARSTNRMVPIPEGRVTLDGKGHFVEGFMVDRFEVTNAEFALFVDATGYVTDAERQGNSIVFSHANGAAGKAPFEVVDGATWRHPKGPASDIKGRTDHPVVHVSWNDAKAYASWCGKRLGTRGEWVLAATGAVAGAIYPWGSELQPGRDPVMNAWDGIFPDSDQGLDGYRGTAPVGSFPPNAAGVCDAAGNVWEWLGERASLGDGPDDEVAERRGGSFLSREEATQGFDPCRGYRVMEFQWDPVHAASDHVGFRCFKSIPSSPR